MSCLPGGLGRVSSRVGVPRHALAACIAGILAAGCSSSSVAPTVVKVVCVDYPGYQTKWSRDGKSIYYGYEIYYWSDGTKTSKGIETGYDYDACPGE